MSGEPTPIKDELVVADDAARHMLEAVSRWYAQFVAEHGVPIAAALVLRNADGTLMPYSRAEAPVGRSEFDAIASLLLAERALERD